MAAVLLFLVQLGNVLGFDRNVRFSQVFSALREARPLSLFVAILTIAVMWNARRLATKLPPLLLDSAAVSLFIMDSRWPVLAICLGP